MKKIVINTLLILLTFLSYNTFAIPNAPGCISTLSEGPMNQAYTVSWCSVPGINTVSYQLVGEGSGLLETITGLSTTRNKGVGFYKYKVRACDSSGCSAYSNATSGINIYGVPTIPGKPETPSFIAENADYTVQWSASTGKHVGYQVVGEQSGQLAQVYNTNITRNKLAGTYYYKVRACNLSGCSGYSPASTGVTVKSVVTATPSFTQPTNNQQPIAQTFQLAWSAVGQDYFELNDGATTFSLSGNSLDKNFPSWGWHTFKVRGCMYDISGCGPWSNPKSIYIYAAPGSVNNLSFPNISIEHKSFIISWLPANGMVSNGYYLVKKGKDFSSSVVICNTTNTYCEDTVNDFANNKYFVQACNPQGVGCGGMKEGTLKNDNSLFYRLAQFYDSTGLISTDNNFSFINDGVAPKYSGASGTGTAKHMPMAQYDDNSKRTFFTYSKWDSANNSMANYIASYYHVEGEVDNVYKLDSRGSNVRDAHDNAALTIDNNGWLWVVVSARSSKLTGDVSRPSVVYKSTVQIDKLNESTPLEFNEQSGYVDNYAYPQLWTLDSYGVILLHTKYNRERVRELWMSNWNNGLEKRITTGGHYSVSKAKGNHLVLAFNHLIDGQADKRSGVYFIQSIDGGVTWKNGQGDEVILPLVVEGTGNNGLSHAQIIEGKLSSNDANYHYMKDIDILDNGEVIITYTETNEVNPIKATGENGVIRKVYTVNAKTLAKNSVMNINHNYTAGFYHPSLVSPSIIFPTKPILVNRAGGNDISGIIASPVTGIHLNFLKEVHNSTDESRERFMFFGSGAAPELDRSPTTADVKGELWFYGTQSGLSNKP